MAKYISEYWKPLDLQDALAAIVGRDGDHLQMLILRRSFQRGSYTEEGKMQIRLLTPHLTHVVRMSAVVEHNNALYRGLTLEGNVNTVLFVSI
jgi:hypothetical protein